MADFRPNGRLSDGIKKLLSSRSKIIITAVIAVIFIFTVFFAASSLTAFVANTNGISLRMDEMENELNASIAARDICMANLGYKAQRLESCSNKYMATKSDFDSCKANEDALVKQNSKIQSELSGCNSELAKNEVVVNSFKNIVRDSVKLICCVPGIKTSSWSVDMDKIICTGNYTINCDSGETSY